MIYENIKKARFISRPNRFIAEIEIGGKADICHVKNTGRCRELLIPGADIYVEHSLNPERKTKYDLISVYKGDKLVNIDSQAPNKVFREWLEKSYSGITTIKPEQTYGSSRFDFYVEYGKRNIFIEVKGVTLENYGICMFPDAPTERGVKHLNELCKVITEGYEAYVVFVVQMSGMKYFVPNISTHKKFAEALKRAEEKGVNILVLDCSVTENSIEINNKLPYRL